MTEVSYALPSYAYRDPAEVLEQDQLKVLGCKACKSHTVYLGKVVCTEPRKINHKDVPRCGQKCKFFIFEG